MSYNWYWKCNQCIPTGEAFLNAIWSGDVTSIKSSLEEAFPYNQLEILSNRQEESRRCKNCKQWHTISTCKKYEPFEIPKCQKHDNKKELFFVETSRRSSVVFIEEAFCKKENPPYLKKDGVFDPYCYIGKRYEQNDLKGAIVLSAVYFSGKTGKTYGPYSPYFYFDDFPFDEFIEWLQSHSNKK